MSESTSITSAVLNRPRENGDPTPNRDASEIDEELDSDDEVLYVDTNENKKLEMKFNPLRGIHTEIHCMGLGPRDDNDLEDGMKGWRGKCYGLAFRPVPLGPPCKAVSVQGDGNCLFRAISYALCCDEAYHLDIRRKCVSELMRWGNVRNSGKAWVLPEGFDTAADYVRTRRVDESGTWGTEVEISALAIHFGLPIYTYYRGKWLVYKPDIPEPIVYNEWERYLAYELYPRQGIYLVNEGAHYQPVVCVKAQGSSDCYGFCKHTTLPRGATRCSYCATQDYYKECTRGRRRKRHGGRGRETKLNTKCDRRQIGERDNAEQDAESYSPSTPWVDEDQSDREARSGRLGERREISTNRTPSLTSLGEEDTDIEIHWVHILHSWKKFLEWLGDRWWGDAPFDKITRALNQPTAQNAMIFSEPREPSRLGALCSIAWKGEKDKLRSHAIVLNRGMYTCTDLRGYFDSPTNIAVDLSRLRGLEILSKPRHLMSHKKSYFYDSRIPTQLRNIKDALKGAWWGTYSRRQSLATMESVLRNLTPFHARVGPYGVQLFDLSCGAETRAGIVTASTDATETRGPGYLFEVLTSPDTLGDVVKYKVVFSARGFMVLTEDGKEQLTTPHADIRGVIHHLTKNQKIVLLSRE